MPADAAASCVLPGGGARSLRRASAALSTFAVTYRGEVYAVSVAATQGAVAASATAEASSSGAAAAPGLLLQLNAAAPPVSQASVSSYVLVAANASDEGVLVPQTAVGSAANQLGVSTQSWSLCSPCAASLGACAAVPAGGPRQLDQLQSFRGATLATMLSSWRGVACTFVAAVSASPAPGGGAASQGVHCAGAGASRAQVTLSLTRFSFARQGTPPPSPPGAPAAAPGSPPNASLTAPAAAACGAGGACSRAAGVNCTCGSHGTLVTSSAGACSCVCDSGWATNPNQDLFAPVYCGMPAATVAAMGNPDVAAGAVPASALTAGSGLSGASLTPSGWALIVGISVGLLCICCYCYRCGMDAHALHIQLACRCFVAAAADACVCCAGMADGGAAGAVLGGQSLRGRPSSLLHAKRKATAASARSRLGGTACARCPMGFVDSWRSGCDKTCSQRCVFLGFWLSLLVRDSELRAGRLERQR